MPLRAQFLFLEFETYSTSTCSLTARSQPNLQKNMVSNAPLIKLKKYGLQSGYYGRIKARLARALQKQLQNTPSKSTVLRDQATRRPWPLSPHLQTTQH